MGVALFDTSSALAPLRGQLRDAVARVLDSQRFILGPEVQAFESEFADYCGAAHGIGVANGTDAITIALRAMGVGPGDDVIVPSFTFYASAEAIPPTGARPVFCDIDPETYCVTPDTVRAALTPQTKAVLAVHLFGNVAPVAEIAALGVPVLEDAAQAAGSLSTAGRPGSLASAATFSFYPSKNLGAFGDGGMITTSDEQIAESARTLRFHGSTTRSATSRSATTRAWTSCRRRSCAFCCRTWTSGLMGGAPPVCTTSRPGSQSSLRCRRRSPARRPPGTSTSSATRAPTSCSARCRRRRSAPAPTTAPPCTASPRWRRGAPACGSRAPSRRPRGTWRFR